MTNEKLWTLIFDHDRLVDALDQSEPCCGMGPETCGGCRDCTIAQLPGNYTIRYDVPTSEMVRIGSGEDR